MAKLLSRYFHRMDNLLKPHQKKASELKRLKVITCQKGCNYCCNQLVMISMLEGIRIAKYVLANQLQAMTVAVVKQGIHQGRMLSGSGYPAEITDSVNKACKAWFRKDKPCGFLKDGLCSIYEVRPSACSTYYVTTPPEKCSLEYGTGDHDVRFLDNTDAICSMTLLDTEFMGELIGQDAVLAPPLPLGVAVSYGLTLLTKGVRAMLDSGRATMVNPGDTFDAEKKPPG